jgi:kinesin family protein 18/19
MDARAFQSAPPSSRDIGTRITVVVRVRPPNPREILSAQGNVIHILDDRVLVFDPPGERIQKQTFLQTSQGRPKELHFGFDKVLSPASTQEDVFNVIKASVFAPTGGLLDGFNCTVFAYGATGSGKTFSMAGTPAAPGIMSRAVEHLFTSLSEQSGRRAKLKLSYLEIYNEQVRDLLAPPDEPPKRLEIVEDPEHGMSVTGLRSWYPENTDEVLELIQIGNNRRTQAQTDSNPVSSRSHAVCQIIVENCEDLPGLSAEHPVGKLSLIDLAGSERATTNRGLRLAESAKINCSLLALSNCINALCTQSSFIPFRQSKLTRLLKDSLGGNCRTVCLSCISPSYLCYDDTYSTLQYANKTKNIRTNLTRNTLNVKARISQYPQIIAELRAQVQQLQAQGGRAGAVESFKRAIEGPFQTQKNSIAALAAKELQDIPPSDVKQQILALQRTANSDIKRRCAQRIAAFSAECIKKRPAAAMGPPKLIDEEQQMKILELENCALRAQIEVNERQLAIAHRVVDRLTEDGLPPGRSLELTASGEAFRDSGTVDSARRPVRAPDPARALRQKCIDAQNAQAESNRRPFESKGPGPMAVSKQRIRLLMDQLSQRVAAVGIPPSGFVQQSRILPQKAIE